MIDADWLRNDLSFKITEILLSLMPETEFLVGTQALSQEDSWLPVKKNSRHKLDKRLKWKIRFY